jgi:hypothetical protein
MLTSIFQNLFIKMYFTVSLGGSFTLFVGASILSFLEIIYFFLIRMRNVKIPKLKRSNTSKCEFKIK